MDWDRPELARGAANFTPLSPVSFLRRAATFFADRTAVVDRDRHFTYTEFYARCRRLAHSLSKAGVGRGDEPRLRLVDEPNPVGVAGGSERGHATDPDGQRRDGQRGLHGAPAWPRSGS